MTRRSAPGRARGLLAESPASGETRTCPLARLSDDDVTDGLLDDRPLAFVLPRSVLLAGRLSAAERYRAHDGSIAASPGAHAACERGLVHDAALFGGRVSNATLAALFERTRVVPEAA
jgi:hypothetical protein